MRRWLLVTKEKDYGSEDSNWIDLDKKDELHYTVDHKIDPGDKILIYRSGQWTTFSHIFEVKESVNLGKGIYQISIYKKITINNNLKLSELKSRGIIKKKRKFRKRVYKIPLEKWNDVVGYLVETNPGLLSPAKPITFLGLRKSGYPINLKNKFLDHIKSVQKFNLESFNEEAAKYRIILPLLEYMGWDMQDTEKIYPEDFVSERYVDYVLSDYESNKICLEAKRPCLDLDDCPQNQLKWYCVSKNIPMGILTNGITWYFNKFYFHDNDLGSIKKTETMKINLLKDDDEFIFSKFIEYLWNGEISNRNVKIKANKPEDILKIAKKTDNLNESQVKQLIVIPLLQSLGWDIYNDKNFIFSSRTEVKIKNNNRKKKKNISMDFVLKGKKKIAIEVKRTGVKDLEIHAGHVKAFCEKKKYDLGITTDGKLWNFIFFKNGRYENEKTFNVNNLSKNLKYLNYIK